MGETTSGGVDGLEGSATPRGPAPRQTDGAERSRRARRLLAMGGVIAGLAAFLIGEATFELIPAEVLPVPTTGPTVVAATAATQATADVKNAALAFAGLGGCLGLCLGLGGGLARRSGGAAAAAGLLGLLLGAAMGAGVTLATLRWFLEAQPLYPDYDMLFTMGMHGLTWGLPAAAAGLAFAVGLGSGERRLLVLAPVAGVVGAMLGAVAFDVVGTLLLPLGNTGDPIPAAWPARLAARLAVALGTVATMILAIPPAHPTRSGSPVHPAAGGTEPAKP